VPFEITREESPTRYVALRMWGTVTAPEFDQISERLIDEVPEWSRLLYDAADLDDPTGALTLFFRSPWRRQIPGHVRQAAVVGPGAAAVARAWTRSAREGSAGAQAFPDRDGAVEWLVGEYQTTTGGS
jgi:hypothetical protein